MADSAAPPPRPRPRPRPKPIAKNSNANAGPSSLSSLTPASSSETVTRRASEIDEEDEYFMKNRNRSSKTWQKLEQMSKDATKPKPTVKHDDSSDSERNSSPRSRNKRTKREKSGSVPLWQKRKDLLSQALSSSDSEVEITSKAESLTPNGRGKRKRRDRSRSRSITPPPALPRAQIQNAKNVVRQTLQATIRPPSPSTYIDADESTDTIIFAPELNALAREIVAGRGSSVAPEQDASTTTTGGDNIDFTVKWQPHPLDPQAQHGVEWQYRIERADNFRQLFEATAEDANVLVPSLIMTYQSKRFFPSVTPQTLKIWTDTAELVAYEKKAYDYIQKNPHSVVRPTATNSSATTTATTSNPIHNNPHEPTAQESDTESQAAAESDAGGDDEDDKFKLILRSALTGDKDITLTVRPMTKCGAILRAFLKKAGLKDRPEYKEIFADAGSGGKKKSKGKPGAKGSGKDPRLCVDGDRLENEVEIGEADLEDGDMVEVVGL